MTSDDARRPYRALIDALVDECRNGQGQVQANWLRRASAPGQDELNALLERLSPTERELIAGVVEETYWGAIHDTLRILNEHNVPPFDESYEGTPYQDFVGRLHDVWDWPV